MTRNRAGRGLRRFLTLALAVIPLVSCATPAQKHTLAEAGMPFSEITWRINPAVQKRALVGAGMAAAAAVALSLSGVMKDAAFPISTDVKSQQKASSIFIILYSSVMGAALGTGLTLAIPNIQQWIEENKTGEIIVRQMMEEEETERRRLAKQQKREEEEAEKQRLAEQQRLEEEKAEKQRLAEQQRLEEEEAEKQRLAGQQRPEEAEAGQQGLAAAEEEKPAEQQREAAAPVQGFVVRRAVRAAPALSGKDTYLFWTGRGRAVVGPAQDSGKDTHLFWTGTGWTSFIENARLFESKEEALASVGRAGDGKAKAVRFEEAKKK